MPSPDSPAGGAGDRPAAGRPVDRRRLERLVRSAARESYGVAAVRRAGGLARFLDRIGIPAGGVAIATAPRLTIEIDLVLLGDVPPTQVARNVAEAVRYRVQRDLGLSIDELVVRVDGRAVPQ
ncbi:MAG TPA: Asp23/Gls24 family envelope stress response protein [Candidatus Limnocylindrales bacterium]